jgi:two-component system, NarL family, response regulator LiaR
MQPIRVMIVDDHAVVRSGLSAFLLAYDDLEIAAQAAGGQEAVELCVASSPDVVLMDLVMPGMDGSAATAAIRAACPSVQVIALTSFPEENLVEAALAAGAIGYLMKNVSADELADAIRAAQQGRATLAPEAAQALVHSANRPVKPGSDLTDRERQVLSLMVEGFSNPAIAETLVVSLSTVKFHVSAVLGKLGVASRTEAVALAIQEHVL